MLCLAVVRLNYKIVIQNDNSHMCGNLSIDTRMREKLFNSNYYYKSILTVKGLVLNATFNSISAILWWSVLLVEETRENH
jgi:hypothetical protein